MFVGDAVIVWRVCVLWPGNRRMAVLGVFLTLVTFGLSPFLPLALSRF